MENFKDRLISAFPVFSQWLKQKMFLNQLITGAVAGDVAVSDILFGDELVSVINLSGLTDVTSEFTIKKDGIINNDGGTSTDTKKLLVTFLQWKSR